MTKYNSKLEQTSRTNSDGWRYSPSEREVKPWGSVALLMENTASEVTGQRRIDVSWLAGLIDGEGCIRMGSSPSVAIESTCRTVIEESNRIIPGSCSSLKRRTSLGRPVFRWKLHGDKAIEACVLVAPFLKDKKEQAVLLASIYNYPPNSAMRSAIIRRLKNMKKVSL